MRVALHNNNYKEFKNELSAYALVKQGDSTYEIYPNKEGVFLFDTREVNIGMFKFQDGFNYENNIIDTNQFRKIDFTITFYNENETNLGTENFSIIFYNGAFQRWEVPIVKDGVVNLCDRLMPCFEGYPFDYSKIIDEGVSRILVSDGETTNNDVNVKLIDTDCCDGYYLKWHNGKFGYSYYLFDRIGKESLKTKSIGLLTEAYSWTPNFFEIGKKGNRVIGLFANVPYEDRELMKSLAGSNEVYLYTGNKGQKATTKDWLQVRISMNVNETNKENALKQKVSLIMPDEATRTRL